MTRPDDQPNLQADELELRAEDVTDLEPDASTAKDVRGGGACNLQNLLTIPNYPK